MLGDWFKANQLSVNAAKTKYMIFNRHQILQTDQNLVLHIDTDQLEKVSTTKFLGLYIDDKLQWNSHIDHCRKKI